MALITYTDHLKLRLKLRKIPEHYPKLIYETPEQVFFDTVERKFIAIKKLLYNKKVRNMMIAYDQKHPEIEIVTIHPISEEKIINRVVNRRWIYHE